MIKIIEKRSGSEVASFSKGEDALFYAVSLQRLRNLEVELVRDHFEVGDEVFINGEFFDVIGFKETSTGMSYHIQDRLGKKRWTKGSETVDPSPKTIQKYSIPARDEHYDMMKRRSTNSSLVPPEYMPKIHNKPEGTRR